MFTTLTLSELKFSTRYIDKKLKGINGLLQNENDNTKSMTYGEIDHISQSIYSMS